MRLTLLMDAPPNLANTSWGHWGSKHRAKKQYWKAQDERQLVGLIPPPPARRLQRVNIHAHFYLWNTMDGDNLHHRLKWAFDWLVTRGYLENDSPDVLRMIAVEQQIDRAKDGRLVLEIAEV